MRRGHAQDGFSPLEPLIVTNPCSGSDRVVDPQQGAGQVQISSVDRDGQKGSVVQTVPMGS